MTDFAGVFAILFVGAAAVAALAWETGGTLLGFGTEDGSAGVIDLR